MHAAFNALMRGGDDRAATLFALVLVQGGLAVCALPFVTWPRSSAWMAPLAGTLLRVTYLLILTRAYAAAAFSRVYPVARGTSPLLTALFGILVLGEHQ